MLISGAGAVKGNLRALNQSVSSQVALLMKNPTKLARRTGVSAQQRPRVLCQIRHASAEHLAEPLADGAADLALGGSNTTGTADEEDLDLEAFDDAEFYAQLLKEFLDSSSAGNAAVAGVYPQVFNFKPDSSFLCSDGACKTVHSFAHCLVDVPTILVIKHIQIMLVNVHSSVTHMLCSVR